jgi:hypothetical protein
VVICGTLTASMALMEASMDSLRWVVRQIMWRIFHILKRSAVRRQGRVADVARAQRWGAAGARAMAGVGRSDESGLGTIRRA